MNVLQKLAKKLLLLSDERLFVKRNLTLPSADKDLEGKSDKELLVNSVKLNRNIKGVESLENTLMKKQKR